MDFDKLKFDRINSAKKKLDMFYLDINLFDTNIPQKKIN